MKRGLFGAILACGSLFMPVLTIHADSFSTPATTSASLPNPTEVFLSTIFLGDIDKTVAYINSLTVGYRSFLTQFVDLQSCAIEDPDLREECIKLKEREDKHIVSGDWTKFYIFHKAEFSPLGDGKSVGTYNFVKSVPLDPKGHCRITMQVTAVVASLDFPVRREFYGECESTAKR